MSRHVTNVLFASGLLIVSDNAAGLRFPVWGFPGAGRAAAAARGLLVAREFCARMSSRLCSCPVANSKHVKLLTKDVDAWNLWRRQAPLERPDLSGADLSHKDLRVANLAEAVLAGANLVMADLRGADLRKADLNLANLVGARMIGVDLQGADLRGADLRTAEDLTPEQLEETLGDERTQLPEGLQRPAPWRR